MRSSPPREILAGAGRPRSWPSKPDKVQQKTCKYLTFVSRWTHLCSEQEADPSARRTLPRAYSAQRRQMPLSRRKTITSVANRIEEGNVLKPFACTRETIKLMQLQAANARS